MTHSGPLTRVFRGAAWLPVCLACFGSVRAGSVVGNVTNGQTRRPLADVRVTASPSDDTVATVTFRVKVADDALAGSLISNQGQLRADKVPQAATDDPTTPQPGDATVVMVGTGPALDLLKTARLTPAPETQALRAEILFAKGRAHSLLSDHAVSRDALILIVEKNGTHLGDVEYRWLDEAERTRLSRLVGDEGV